jgi:hypothetical protein
MHHGEYSDLLHQIRVRRAGHLGENYWRVTLPEPRTRMVCATEWRLITILPKSWKPPQEPAAERQTCTEDA